MRNKFEDDLEDLDKIFYQELLPSTSDKRLIILTIVVDYSPYQNQINFVFHGSSSVLKNDAFLTFKREVFRNLSVHVAALFQKYVPNSILNDNVVKIPVNYDQLYKCINFFEKDFNWNLEWITKWELRKVFADHHDLILTIDSNDITDNDLVSFLTAFEKNLKKHFVIF
jgi:hypothetical protein